MTAWTRAVDEALDAGANKFDASQALARAFAVSQEFDDLYGNFTVEGVVREFYLNNLGRDPLSIDPVTGVASDLPGYQFWTDVTNNRIEDLVDGGASADEAFNTAIEELAVNFVFATETQETVFKDPITTLLVNIGLDGDDALDPGASLFDVAGEFRPEAEADPFNPLRTMLRLNSVEGAEEIGGYDADNPFAVAGINEDTNEDGRVDADTLRLTGDASVRIDLTDFREQLEGIDIDGSGEIEFDEQDNAFRSVIDVSDFEIFDAHPRGDALLNPAFTTGDAANIGFTGNLYFDGTGYDGTGTNLNGNIVLGGWGQDTIFTGNGNEFRFDACAGRHHQDGPQRGLHLSGAEHAGRFFLRRRRRDRWRRDLRRQPCGG